MRERGQCDFCGTAGVTLDAIGSPAVLKPLRICEVCDELGVGGTPEHANQPATQADLSRAVRFLLTRLVQH